MKIAASAVQWQSQHSAVRVEAHTSRLQSWVGQRPSTPDANLPAGGAASSAAGQAGAALARSALHLSEQAQRLLRDKAPSVQGEAVTSPSIDDLGTNLTPLLRMASQLIEEMTGVRANILRLEAGRPSNIEVPDAPSKGGVAANRQPAGWGLEYDSHSVVEEAESTRWAAQGVVRTADGREISFSVELQMQRTYRKESHTSLRLGDAQLTDPLVINFDGSAAELQDIRFAFDLNSDGQASEQVPLLAGNRGFLALDRNQNQRIDAGNELFGPRTGNGFSELADYDDDGNGWIDENDRVFQDLRVWTPASDSTGSLRTLQEVGVGAISLAAGSSEFALRTSDNRSLGQIRATSAYLREDGGAGTVQQVDLSA